MQLLDLTSLTPTTTPVGGKSPRVPSPLTPRDKRGGERSLRGFLSAPACKSFWQCPRTIMHRENNCGAWSSDPKLAPAAVAAGRFWAAPLLQPPNARVGWRAIVSFACVYMGPFGPLLCVSLRAAARAPPCRKALPFFGYKPRKNVRPRPLAAAAGL